MQNQHYSEFISVPGENGYLRLSDRVIVLFLTFIADIVLDLKVFREHTHNRGYEDLQKLRSNLPLWHNRENDCVFRRLCGADQPANKTN